MISSASQLLYSVSAVRRFLGLPGDANVQVREFSKVIWVWVAGKRPTFISKAVFKAHFVEWRKAAARSLVVVPAPSQAHHFRVRNEGKLTLYVVRCENGRVSCDCEDYKNQKLFFGKGCCKHAYAVLGYLGYTSLAEYQAA